MQPAAYPSRFAGKTVIVTGAGSGIGLATATRLANEGARVIATDVVAQRLADLAAGLVDFDVVTVIGDVAAAETTAAIVAAADGRVDGLANVAGIMDAFLPLMLAAGTGTIVNVASEASHRASASGAAYTSSKHALVGFTKSVAFFYGPQGIRANAVAPGAVATNIEAPWKSDFAAGRIGPILQATVGSVAQPAALAAAITWLLSEDSANVNGAILPGDGGWSTI